MVWNLTNWLDSTFKSFGSFYSPIYYMMFSFYCFREYMLLIILINRKKFRSRVQDLNCTTFGSSLNIWIFYQYVLSIETFHLLKANIIFLYVEKIQANFRKKRRSQHSFIFNFKIIVLHHDKTWTCVWTWMNVTTTHSGFCAFTKLQSKKEFTKRFEKSLVLKIVVKSELK